MLLFRRVLIVIVLLLSPLYALADEECVFDSTSYSDFAKKYASVHNEVTLDSNTFVMTVKRDGDTISVSGGGCYHLGGSIAVSTKQTLTDKELYSKVISLTEEFGNWLINVDQLKAAFKNSAIEVIDGLYNVRLDEMTTFTFYYSEGGFMVEFGIN